MAMPEITDVTMFQINPDAKTFSAFASDVNGAWQFIALRNPKTGRTVMFTMRTTHRDAEFEATHWDYTPTIAAVRESPAVAGWKVVLFND